MPDSLNPQQRNSYADRPVTPCGTPTGFTETKTSGTHEPEHPKEDRYRYQPAYFWSHPAAYLRETSNYLKACAARLPRSGRSTPKGDKNKATEKESNQNESNQNNGALMDKVVRDEIAQKRND
jgi:hypothetical protein